MARPHEHQDSPVDLPGSIVIGGRPLAWTSGVIATATFFLLFANATAIRGWAVELEPSPFTARIVSAAEAWEETTDRFDLGATRATVHAYWKRAQAARFGNENPDAE